MTEEEQNEEEEEEQEQAETTGGLDTETEYRGGRKPDKRGREI